MLSMSRAPAAVGFLGRNYRNKFVAIKIPRDAGLAPIPYTGRKILIGDQTSAASCSTSLKQDALKCITKGVWF